MIENSYEAMMWFWALTFTLLMLAIAFKDILGYCRNLKEHINGLGNHQRKDDR